MFCVSSEGRALLPVRWRLRASQWGMAILMVVVLNFPQVPLAGEKQVPQAGEKRELVLLTWPDYMDPDLLEKFEKKTGVSVRMVYFETDETRDELLARAGGEGFDVADIFCDRVGGYAEQGWLAPIDATLVPNMRRIGKRWLEAYPGVSRYALPYFWGTFGIAYRPDLLGETITRWRDLLVPSPKLRGKILMEKDSRSLLVVALKALGGSSNAFGEEALRDAMQLLIAQKPFVKDYGYPSMDEKSGLVTGEIWAATLYNGDTLFLQGIEPRIQYVLPEDGPILWMDCMAVLNGSRNKKSAYEFIDFLHEPENAAKLSRELGYASTDPETRSFLPAEHVNNALIHPPAEVVEKSELKFLEPIPVQAERRMKALLHDLLR
ncbi:MAG: spermidine/putrescine ABC transporter substrate-binding protein [Magnetococcales bacterium]|nr:spermidine/putrescine ABC transporter substrate-binding protein [Magnetococcales bacterium]